MLVDPVEYMYGYLLPQWRTYRTSSGERVRYIEWYELWRDGQLCCCVRVLLGPQPIAYDAYQRHTISQTIYEVH